MRFRRFALIFLFVTTVSGRGLAKGESSDAPPAPEVFAAFAGAWADYTDGYYADALLGFYEAGLLDSRFRPSIEGVQACLWRMGLEAIAEEPQQYFDRNRRRSASTADNKSELLAFWGIYSDEGVLLTNAGRLEEVLLRCLQDLCSVEVRLVEPLAKNAEGRKAAHQARYNLLAMVREEADGVSLSLHLIEELNVEVAADIDFFVPGAEPQLAYRQREINLGEMGYEAYFQSVAGEQMLAGLLFGEVEPVSAPFRTRPWLDELVSQGDYSDLTLAQFMCVLSQVPRRHELLDGFHDWDRRDILRQVWPVQIARYLLESPSDYPAKDLDFYWQINRSRIPGWDWHIARSGNIFLEHYPDSIPASVERINRAIQQLSPSSHQEIAEIILFELDLIQQRANQRVGLGSKPFVNAKDLERFRELMEYYAGHADQLSFYPGFPLRFDVLNEAERFRYFFYMGGGRLPRVGDDDFSEEAARVEAELLLQVIPIWNQDETYRERSRANWPNPWGGVIKKSLPRPPTGDLIVAFILAASQAHPDALLPQLAARRYGNNHPQITQAWMQGIIQDFKEDPRQAYQTHKSFLITSGVKSISKRIIQMERDPSYQSKFPSYDRQRASLYTELRDAVIEGLAKHSEDADYWEGWVPVRFLKEFRVPWEMLPSRVQHELIHPLEKQSLGKSSAYELRADLIDYLKDQANPGVVRLVQASQSRLCLEQVIKSPASLKAYLPGVEAAWVLQDFESIRAFHSLFGEALAAGKLDVPVRNYGYGANWEDARATVAVSLDICLARVYAAEGDLEQAVAFIDERLAAVDLSDPHRIWSVFVPNEAIGRVPRSKNVAEQLLQAREMILHEEMAAQLPIDL